MAVDTVNDVLGAVPGARPTSTYRTPEHNRAVGGVPGSHHTRGTPDNPHAVDLVPAPGETMAQLHARVRGSGVNTIEAINEGDHVHVAVNGVPRESRDGGQMQEISIDGAMRPILRTAAGYENSSPDELAAAGFRQADNGQWFKEDLSYNATAPEPLDMLYAERQQARETLALDQEEADLRANVVQAGLGITDDAAAAVARDVGKGLFVEGGQAVVSGLKRGLNEMGDLVEAFNDATINRIPGVEEGGDAVKGAAFSVGRMVRNLMGGADRRTAEEANAAPSARLPTSEAERPETVTGNIIEGVTQFATGMIAGGEILKPIQAISRAGRVGKAMAQGAIADFSAFDGNQARLSNLLADHSPAAIAPMFEYLAADEDDPELLGRFKNAVEGAFIGGGLDLVTAGVRTLRAARRVRSELRASATAEGLQIDPVLPVSEARVAGEQAEAVVRQSLGNPEGPAFRVRPDPTVVIPDFSAKVAAQADGAARATVDDALGARPTDNVFDINLARMDTPEAIQNTITGMADRLRDNVDLGRRATVSHEQTMAAATRLDWVSSMAARRTGDAANAETVTAYRLALNASAVKLQELAQAVKTASSTPAEAVARQYALRRAATVHAAIQHEFMGARAEAGRALSAFRIATGAPENSLRQIDSLLADMGSRGTAESLADAVLAAAKNGDVALNQTMRQGALAQTREAIKFVYTNGLLSGIGTPLINVAGNGLMLGLNVVSRAVAPRLARAFGGEGTTQVGEAGALVAGYQQAMRDIFRLNPLQSAQQIAADGGRALRQEGIFRGMAPGIDDAAPAGIQLRAEREEAGALTSNTRPLSAAFWRVDEDTALGRTLDVLHMLVGAPSNLNELSDDFFKVVAARGELHSQAFRRTASEGLETEAARARYAELLENPTDDMLKAAEDQMHDLTFTRDVSAREFRGEKESPTRTVAQAFSDGRIAGDSVPIPFGTMILPFIKTPANLVSMGMRFAPLAPLSRRFRNDIAAGGARAETAKAQMAVGTALWSVWMGMAMDGQITGSGPGNAAQKEALMRADEYGGQTWAPYSVKLGDRWYSFERADPLGQGLSLIGDAAEMMKNADWDSTSQQEWSEVMAHGIMALGSAFFDKTMLKSATDLTSSLLGGTEGQAERTLGRQASSLLPFSSILRTVRRGQDPYLRETSNVIDSIRNTIPGFSDDLPPQRDLWGKPRTYQTGLGTVYDAIVPVQTREAGGSAIDLEILNNGVSVRMPDRAISSMGERVSLKNRPDIYSDFVELAGQPAYEQLNAVVEGRHPDSEFYFSLSDGPDGGKADYIKAVIDDHRGVARAVILDRYAADLQSMAAEGVRRRNEVRLDQ